MIFNERTNNDCTVRSSTYYAVRLKDGTVEVAKWVNGKGWQRCGGNNGYLDGGLVVAVICAVSISD
jgi:hypothetical protein